MLEDNKEDFLNRGIDFSLISLFSSKLRIGIIGAGRGGYIKAKHFLEQGCYVEVLTKDVREEFTNLKSHKLKIIKKKYERSFILDKHIIVIAINDEEETKEIKLDCESIYKIYIDSTSFKDGMGSIPVQRSLSNIVIGINTKGGNPKGAVMVAEKAVTELNKYDDFVGFTTLIRNKVKSISTIKKDVINFIAEDDFFFFFQQGKAKEILMMFFQNEL